MVRHGIKGVVPGGGRVEEIAVRWQEALRLAGRETDLGEDLALVLQIHLADTQEQAVSEATCWFEEQLKVLAPLDRMPALTQEQVDATYHPGKAPYAGLPTIGDLVRDGAWICGPPEHAIEQLEEIQDRLPGLERVTVSAGGLAMPPSVLKADLKWFGEAVMPRFI